MFNTVVFLCGLLLLGGAIYWRSAQMASAGMLTVVLVWLWRIEQLLMLRGRGPRLVKTNDQRKANKRHVA